VPGIIYVRQNIRSVISEGSDERATAKKSTIHVGARANRINSQMEVTQRGLGELGIT